MNSVKPLAILIVALPLALTVAALGWVLLVC
jgi:hypothetical protein